MVRVSVASISDLPALDGAEYQYSATEEKKSNWVKVDELFHYSELTMMGHKGPALCVDGNEDMNYLVTGGEDATARVWRFDPTEYACFRLVRVLVHNEEGEKPPKVTSVDFHGSDGPVVTVTDQGHLFLWELATENYSRYARETEPIRRVTARQHSLSSKILLGYAVGKHGKLVLATPMSDSGGKYDLEDLCVVSHEDTVRYVEHIPGSYKDGAAMATSMLNCNDVMVWNMEGKLLHRLQGSSHVVTSFVVALSQDSDVGWILSGGGDIVSLWPTRKGKLIGQDDMPVEADDISPKPLVEYKLTSTLKRLDIDPLLEFIVTVGEDLKTDVTFIKRPESAEDAVAASGPGRLMLDDGKEQTLCQIRHNSEVSDMAVYRVGGDNALLAITFANGTCELWDVDGPDAGERVASLRSVGIMEIVIPVAMLSVSFLQYVTFAFGPATNFNHHVEKTARASEGVIDFDLRKFSFHVDHTFLFWVQIYGVITAISLFIFIAATGIPDKMVRLYGFFVRSAAYSGGGTCGCRRLLAVLTYGLEQCIDLFMMLGSTVFVVPMFKHICDVFHCIDPLDGSPPFLEDDPETICYETTHLYMVCLLGVILPTYFWILLPHAAVAGDVEYVNSLFKMTVWRQSAVRKACLIFNGPLHPLQSSIFPVRISELCSKIALPCVADLMTNRPLTQTICIAFIGLVMLVSNLVNPPLVDVFWNAILQGTHLFTFLAMSCGVMTVVMPNAEMVSSFGLLGAAQITFLFVVWRATRTKTQKRHQGQVYHSFTSVNSRAASDAFPSSRGS